MGGRYSTNGLIPCSIPGRKSSMPSFELLATKALYVLKEMSEIPFFYRRWAACMSYCPYVNTCWVRDWWLSSVCSNGTNRFKLFFLLPFLISYFPRLFGVIDRLNRIWTSCTHHLPQCLYQLLFESDTRNEEKSVYFLKTRPVLEKPKKAHSLSNTSPVIEKEVNKKFLTPKSKFESRS